MATSIDCHCTVISSITKVKTYITIYILKHTTTVQGLYQENTHCRLRIYFRLETKTTEKRFYSWKEEGNSHIVPYIFLQVPEGNNRQATEISNFSKASSITDSSGCLQADTALGRSCFFKPQIPSQSGMPLGLPGSEHRKAGLKTHHSLPSSLLRRVQCCPSRVHPRSLNITLLP